MRRSNSSSCIPLPSSLVRRSSKTSIPRSRSVSTSRASGSRGLTPTSTNRRNLYSSTPSSTPSCSGSATKKAKNTLFFNGVSPKKLWSDKQWVAHQHAKVRDYIVQNMAQFDSSVVQHDKLKPPPLKSFINIVTVLLSKVMARVDPINTVNYKEVVTRYLKLLNCPVLPSMSTLKIVSSMHVYPQIMCLLSWLIDFTNQVNQEPSVDDVPEELRQNYLLKEFVVEMLNKCKPGVDLSDELKEEMEERCDQILDIDVETLQRLESEAASNQNVYEKLEEQYQAAHTEKLTLELDIKSMKDQLIEFENDQEEYIKKIADLQSKIPEIQSQIKKLENSMYLLKDTIQNQKMSLKEKEKIQKEIEDLKSEVERRTENLEKINKIRDELDLQQSSLQKEIQTAVDQWNIALLRTSTDNQKMLKLREKGFFSSDFLQEINEVMEKKSSIEEQVTKQIEEINKKLYEVSKKINSAEHQREAEKKSDEVLQGQIAELKIELMELENKNHKISEEIQAQIPLHEANTKKLKEVQELKMRAAKEEIDIKRTISKLKSEKDELMVKGTSFFMQYHQDCMEDIAKMDNVRKKAQEVFSEKQEVHMEEMTEQIKIIEDLLAG